MAGNSIALVMMGLVAFFSFLTVGMLAPFLPQHMASIGADERWSGVIFAFYSIAVMATTPLANALVNKLGRPPLVGLGLILQAASVFVFGVCNQSLTVLLVCRFLQGCGAGASNLAMFAIAADLYSDSIGKVMGFNELCIGAGFSIGPLVGAVLFEHGGFPMPFVVCSIQMLLIALLTPVLARIPVPEKVPDVEAEKADASQSTVQRLWAVCTDRLLAPAGLLVLGTAIWGIIDSGFYTVHADHDLHLGQTMIGLNLAAASAAYAGFGLCAGALSDRIGSGITMLMGASLVAVSLVFVGPLGGSLAEMIHGAEAVDDDELRRLQSWLECAALVVLGTGQAAMLIPSLGAMKNTVPDGDPSATEACISVFNFFQQAGLVVGPLASSALGSRYNLGTMLLAILVTGYSLLVARPLLRSGRAVKDSLLRHNSPPRVMQGSPAEFPSPAINKVRNDSFH